MSRSLQSIAWTSTRYPGQQKGLEKDIAFIWRHQRADAFAVVVVDIFTNPSVLAHFDPSAATEVQHRCRDYTTAARHPLRGGLLLLREQNYSLTERECPGVCNISTAPASQGT